MRDGTLRRLARGLGALAVLVLLVVGIPIALALLVGWPLPHGLPSWEEFRSALTTSGPGDEMIVNSLAVICWIAWAVLAASVVLEVAGVVRGRGSRRVPFAGPVQALAANLVAAVVLTLPSLAARTTPSAAQPLAARLQAPTMSPIAAAAPPVLQEPDQPIALMSATSASANEVTGAEETHTVVRRDTLWGIAEVHLGDPFRWPELFELNRGRPQIDGRTLSDPNLIRPGWVLVLPTGTRAPAQTEQPPTTGARPSGEGKTSTRATVPVPGSPADTSASTTTTAATARSMAQPTRPPDGHPTDKGRSSDGSGIDLPGGSVVGLSLAAGIGASLAAVRLRRRRSRVPRPPEDGITWEEPLATPAIRRLRRADLAERSRRPTKGAGHDGPSAAGRTEQRPAGIAAKVSLGDRAGEQVELDLLATGPVGLAGPGGYGVARALVVDFVSNASEQAAEVVVAGPALAEQLFPGVEPFAGMEIAGDLEAAITRLEVELVHRTRLIDETDDADFASYVEQNPVEPLPALVLVAQAVRSGLRLRLDAVASVGGRLGISAVVLDPPSSMAAITIAEGGAVEEVSATPTLSDLRGAQLFSLEPVEATELLSVVAAGRGAPEPMEGIAEHRPESFDLEDVPAAGPIVVHLLGTYRIEANGEEIRTGFRTKARELLAFLLLHPQGKSVEAAVDAIWPDSDLARGAEGFRTAVGNLRKVVRAVTQNPKARVIERVGERYRVEPSIFDCDLWRLEAALREAKLASGSDAAAPLERAAKECCGDLLDGAYYEWAEAPREDIRRRVLDAMVRSADLRQESGDDEGALTILEEAVGLDPYGEETYRRLIAVQLRLARSDSARRTFKQLESRLSELDLDPDETTVRLLPSAQGTHPTSHPAQAGARE